MHLLANEKIEIDMRLVSPGVWVGRATPSIVDTDQAVNLSDAEFSIVACDSSAFGFAGAQIYVAGYSGSVIGLRSLRVAAFDLESDTQYVLANGWQCWTESPLMGRTDILRRDVFPERRIFGDDSLIQYSELPGQIHSWSFSYSLLPNGRHQWFGSCDEDTTQTAFCFDLAHNRLSVYLEVEQASTTLARDNDFYTALGKSAKDRLPENILTSFLIPNQCVSVDLSSSCATWFRIIQSSQRVGRSFQSSPRAKETHPTLQGFTSWYYFYNQITADLLLERMQQIVNKTPSWKVFQIDDGYQKQIGDWLEFSDGFPNGIKGIADVAVSKGLVPGIWIAPFIVSVHSKIFKNNPDWLLRCQQGNPVLCGDHPLWNGKFYALDSENPRVLEYLKNVFSHLFTQWGFRFLKADFLYACAMIATPGISRALRSTRAHEFLMQICLSHGVQLLSCGSQLSASYGRCHYARIGADVGTTWENDEFGSAPSREKVSTRASIVNTVTRSCLNGITFGNDPDVVILRDDRQSMTWEQRCLLASANSSLGSLVFCSDNPSTFDKQKYDMVQCIGSNLKSQNSVSSICYDGASFSILNRSGHTLQLNMQGNLQ